MEGEEYLGDGLYASWDGTYIMLRAPREHGNHYVGLELVVYRNLLEFAKRAFAGQVTPVNRGNVQIVEVNPNE